MPTLRAILTASHYKHAPHRAFSHSLDPMKTMAGQRKIKFRGLARVWAFNFAAGAYSPIRMLKY